MRLRLAVALIALLLAPLATANAQPLTPFWQPQIAIVWPHDPRGVGAPIEQSTLINVSVWPTGSVPCDADPQLQLLVAKGAEPTDPFGGTYLRIFRRTGQGTYPSLEFNDVLANIRDNPGAQFRLVTFGEARPTRSDFTGNVWVHATDARTILPNAVVPTGYSNMLVPTGGFDARIQVVFPKDQMGNPQPVERATFVNVAVEVFEHDTLLAAIPDAAGNYPFSLTLLMAEGNGPLQPVDRDAHLRTYAVNGQEFPRWDFNNIPVRPGTQTHFVVSLLAAGAKAVSPYSTIWTHAVDPRTFLPAPSTPPPCVSTAQAVTLAHEIAYRASVRLSDDPSPAGVGCHIVTVKVDGSDPVDLTPQAMSCVQDPAYSPDGGQIAFIENRRGATSLHLMNANGSNAHRLAERTYSQTYGPLYWSHDGQRVAFYYPGDLAYHAYAVADGDGPEVLSRLDPAIWDLPERSPDGRYQATFCPVSGDPSTGYLCVQELASGATTRVTQRTFSEGRGIDWSPDGGRLVFGALEGIFVVNADGSGLARIAEGHSPTWR